MNTNEIFTPREQEILRQVAFAKVRKEIANQLAMKQNTVSTHLKTISLKTNTHGMQELTRWAIKNGFDNE